MIDCLRPKKEIDEDNDWYPINNDVDRLRLYQLNRGE